jgi:hypothetical protein
MPNLDNKAFNMMNESADKVDNSESVHTALMAAGMIPGPTGMAADLADASLYAKEKKWKDMGFSLMGAIPILGQVISAGKIAKIKKATKSIEATKRLKRIAKYERMTESIENGSLLFANKKWQKAIDKGNMWIDNKTGDLIGTVGENVGTKIGNVYETPRYERYSDYYKMMNEVSDDMKKVVKTLSPQELAFAKEMGKSPKIQKEMRDMVLKLEKLLPAGD